MWGRRPGGREDRPGLCSGQWLGVLSSIQPHPGRRPRMRGGPVASSLSWAGLPRVGLSDPRRSGRPLNGSQIWAEEGNTSQQAAAKAGDLGLESRGSSGPAALRSRRLAHFPVLLLPSGFSGSPVSTPRCVYCELSVPFGLCLWASAPLRGPLRWVSGQQGAGRRAGP